MHIFLNNCAVNCKSEPIGEINPCSIYNLDGPSYIHLNKHYRKSLRLKNYDEFFPTMSDACEWLSDNLHDFSVMGCMYDFETGHCKTLEDIINE